MCPDGNPCATHFMADGTMYCRHGVCSKSLTNNTAAVKFVCPLKLLEEYEKEKWMRFFDWMNSDEYKKWIREQFGLII